MPNVTMTLEEYEALRRLIGSERESEGASEEARATSSPLRPKPKRKVSEYQKNFGRQLKALKRKHPRLKGAALMKKAHKATRTSMRTIAKEKGSRRGKK